MNSSSGLVVSAAAMSGSSWLMWHSACTRCSAVVADASSTYLVRVRVRVRVRVG